MWKLQNISHSYSLNVGINTTGNVVPYHSKMVSFHQEKAFKDIGDEIANSI